MILYFSGTGNSEYAAKRIGKELQDQTLNLFEKLRDRDFSQMGSEKPWVIVAPTYCWRIPRILQEWLENTPLTGNKDIYFVLTCGGNIGNSGAYTKKLCRTKGMNDLGCIPIVMPENYIALFHTPGKEEAMEIIRRAETAITEAAQLIKTKQPYCRPSVTLMDRLSSGIVNDLYYPVIVHAKKFYATDACISCGECETLCPLKNIHMEQGKPVWEDHCTHCMACICRCPSQAIEYGKNSKGQVRYIFPKELTKKLF